MATYTIIPSSFTAGSGTVSNPDRAYTDTSSSTYASVTVPNAGNMYLGGFDFSTIPSGYIISAITVKIKWRKNSGQADYYAKLIGKSSGTDVALSSDLTSQYPAATSTFTLTESAATVASYASTLAINFRGSSGSPQGRIYGVEVIVTADKPPANKVIYGNNTLIDLTSDTVTAADVASGKTFHLANGAIGTGINTNNCDTSSDTVTAADVINSKTFHLANGNSSAGTCTYNCNTSSDTVTAADVASGKTFHLANGTQGIGTASGATIKTKTGYPNSYGITFRELANEPTWFLVACMSPGTTAYSTITFFMLYNGTTTYIMNGVGSSGSRTQRAVYSGSNAFTFSYTSGVLAISGNINNFNIPSTYETYTLYYI